MLFSTKKPWFLVLFLGLLPSTLFAKLPTHFTNQTPSNYYQFWFLYEAEKRGAQSLTAIRPFYYGYSDKTTALESRSYLMPLFYREETNHWYTWTSLFFFTGTGIKHPEGDEEEDATLMPFFFWGKGESLRESYFGFFPFYGHLRSKLSYSEIKFAMFPVYAEWKYKTYSAKSILWPFLLIGKSEFRNDFRLFPFYSVKEHLGKYKRQSILWPFIQWGEEKLNKKEPTSYSFFFPFYNRKDSQDGNMKSRAFLWFPILNSLFSYGYDRKTGHRNYSALFIFFQYATSDKKDMEKIVIFPFYGYSYFANKEAEYITPFYIRLTQNTSHLKAEDLFFLPFLSIMNQEFPQTGRKERYIKFWPFFRIQEDSEANYVFNTVSLLPVRFEAFEDVWDPIFSIVEYKKESNGEKRINLVSRLYSQRWTDKKTSIHIPLLAEIQIEESGFSYQFLYGFLGIDTRKEKSEIQILWLLKV